MSDQARLLVRRSTAHDLRQLTALLSTPSVAVGYFGSPGAIKLAGDTLAHNLAEAVGGRGEVWAGCAADQPATILAYAAVIDGTLAYLVHPAWQGMGLATSIARLACVKSFEERAGRAIGAAVFRGNIASQTVLERLGFRFTGLCWPTVLGSHQPRAMLRFELEAQNFEVGTCLSMQ